MRILAIDTSCGAASVAVFEGATRETLASRVMPMRLGHADALTPLVRPEAIPSRNSARVFGFSTKDSAGLASLGK